MKTEESTGRTINSYLQI